MLWEFIWIMLGIPNSPQTFSHLTYITFNNSRTISFLITIIRDWLWIVKKKCWFHVKITNNLSQPTIYNMYGKDCNPKNNSIVHSIWKIIDWLITTHKEKHNIGTHHYQKRKMQYWGPITKSSGLSPLPCYVGFNYNLSQAQTTGKLLLYSGSKLPLLKVGGCQP